MIYRDYLIKLVDAAKQINRLDFAFSLATDWLAFWPGDAEVQLIVAQIESERQLFNTAVQRLFDVLASDPENVEAYDLLANTLRASNDPTRARVYAACAAALRGSMPESVEFPSWATHLSSAITALSSNDPQSAAIEIQETLTADPDLPLPMLVAVRSQLAMRNRASAIGMAQTGLNRWPECLYFRLLLADELLTNGEIGRAVTYIHQCVGADPLGRVSLRILGDTHPYQNLWPTEMAAKLTRSVPGDVADILGNDYHSLENTDQPSLIAPNPKKPLSSSKDRVESEDSEVEPLFYPTENKDVTSGTSDLKKASDDDIPAPMAWETFRGPNAGDDVAANEDHPDQTLQEIDQEFTRLASRLNTRRRSPDEDGRIPAYIILSSRSHLTQSFGDDNYQRIDEAILSLKEAVRSKPGWTAYRIYIDDPTTLDSLGLSPVDPSNAWKIKLRLADLDQALSHRGEMIGALLIVGGDHIVPFHMLPNPTDDDDQIVPSDNPYATTDENYFAPEWAVGRLPTDDDQDLLIRLLNEYAEEHQISNQRISIWLRFRIWLARKLGWLFRNRPRALGYSASIWRKASFAVFKTIGEPSALLTSPPIEATHLPRITMRPARYSYFNLHGIEDAPEWFGQRDPLRDDATDPVFPIALRPQDVINGGNAPKIVFTEACYGANVLGKSIDSSLCLKFLDSGSRAVIGSTKISYGSITTPLIAADLLGRLFWEHLTQSLPAGEALRRAKLMMAAEMHRRQGFLDGEDQKTIISFVLYGDPLYTPSYLPTRSAQKMIIRRTSRPTQMKTVCTLGESDVISEDLESIEFKRVKAIVSQYLPGMADAQCQIRSQHHGCDGVDHHCPSHQLGIKKLQTSHKDNLVFTFSKSIREGVIQHPHFVRLTVDAHGKVLKLAVSR